MRRLPAIQLAMAAASTPWADKPWADKPWVDKPWADMRVAVMVPDTAAATTGAVDRFMRQRRGWRV